MDWMTRLVSEFAVPLLATLSLLGLLIVRVVRTSRAALLRPGIAPILFVGIATAAVMLVGSLTISPFWGRRITLISLGGIGLLLVALLLTRRWSKGLMLGLSIGLLLGSTGWATPSIQAGINESGRMLRSLQVVHPLWLVALAVLPWMIWISRKSLAGLGPIRSKLALATRIAVTTLLILALAELRLSRTSENTTVLYLVDRSYSVPQEISPQQATVAGEPIDLRWQRIQEFLNESVQQRGLAHRNDASGAILFARRPRLVLPPSPVDRLLVNDAMAGTIDLNYTDIASALKLALASFPEGTGKRIVLLSDGNENLGNAEEQAQLAKQNGIEIDTITLASGIRNESEVLVEAVEAPPLSATGVRLPPIRVLIRNTSPNRTVDGNLELLQLRDGIERPIPIIDSAGVIDSKATPPRVRLRPGLNSFRFRDPIPPDDKSGEGTSFSYRAIFQPLESAPEAGGKITVGLPGDRYQNNRAGTHVVLRGKRRVLFLEATPAGPGGFTHQHLIDTLRRAKLTVVPLSVDRLPSNRAELTVFLADFDCVVIANVPSELLSKDQQDVIRANTGDQGCGLVVVGGPESYGAGGYQDTPIEKALPVDCQIKAIKAAGKGGLVLIMHASEMADGNRWQKEIAKLAIKKLSPVDMVGMLYYGFNTQWHIPFQTVGEDRDRLLAMVDRMTPGDMPDFDPGLQMAFETLSDPQYDLATRHVMIISDGDPTLGVNGTKVLNAMPDFKITCTTVGVATHGPASSASLETIAKTTKGRFYNVTDPAKLPAIYIREARRVSQSFLYEQRFAPKLVLRSGPSENLPGELPALYGFIRTSMKASPLAEMLIEGPRVIDQRFPILATWQYGLGRSVAFTSDARSLPPKIAGWDRDWAASDLYLKHWEQSVNWAMRGVETGKLSMISEYRDGRVRVTVTARDEQNRAMTGLKLRGGVTLPNSPPDGKPITLDFQQKAGGVYEAEFPAEEAGSYFLNAQALDETGKPLDSVRSGTTIPYSPEFADLESNPVLLRRLSDITGGRHFEERETTLRQLASSGELYRKPPEATRSTQPIWFWLVFAAGLGLLMDVGIRRIAIEPAEVAAWSQRIWTRLRTKRQDTEPASLDRLAEVKAQVGEVLERKRASRRFEPSEAPATTLGPPPGADELPTQAPSPSRPAPLPPPVAPPTNADTNEDPFERLKRAKRRAPIDRNRTDDPPTSPPSGE
ncbi:vWA domain-containing protein [Tuwongella immobilis]|uniref:VWFA domain-containing protein n=1 Tax=Tuwongella immobilis TaxID=692036 RepID=A0A6C2YMU1_9BACT|nr:VWA domain-containing protein [Tuwongella immobilis]VIP02529.1 Uncharacterized membrane protein OS=Singulisphaera acidiphila (strain ATCC BAA-1392 / DSM 18658 / VKM B-2454 / MOB10) GN=Sinac_2617 PE=4 SV=1: VWA_2: DUF1355: VWA_2 [Tuwongella immobilis]VTS01676.1 Uncharacterized membrane protein OS=Singulisphaera acidiphila (strain ATCC BAA-1392 / DSM 18658 / VKM B-2454 / MOB10) GN=Sinac_2617 PE=4 SV=1: VWA_2: DUF1355: VWA_2 [Tuwongella immobilis]